MWSTFPFRVRPAKGVLRARLASWRDTLAPYAGRIAVSGLAGISIGPVSGYVGLLAHLTGDLDEAEALLRSAIDVTVRFGWRAHESRVRAADRSG